MIYYTDVFYYLSAYFQTESEREKSKGNLWELVEK